MTRAEANADPQLYRFSPFRFVVRYPNLVPQYKRQLRPDLDADRKHALVTIFPLPGKLFVLIWSRLKQLVSVPRSDIYTLTVSDEILFLPHDLPPPLPSILDPIKKVPGTSGLKQARGNIAAFNSRPPEVRVSDEGLEPSRSRSGNGAGRCF
jgi:hypothetical protein